MMGLLYLWAYDLWIEHQNRKRRDAALIRVVQLLKEVQEHPFGRRYTSEQGE